MKTNSEREFVMLAAKENVQQIITIEIPKIKKYLPITTVKTMFFRFKCSINSIIYSFCQNPNG